jgi:HD-like signal output (HDOD) protein/DNA-binding response OmpR family regulator
MANILLFDDSEVAGKAFRGIVDRGGHRCVVARTAEVAWRLLREGVVVDIVFLETKTGSGAGFEFLGRVRADPIFALLPVAVYSSDPDSRAVRRALGFKVTNYLIKPYGDKAIHGEIAKALQNPWRELHFEETKSFCALMQLTPAALADKQRRVLNTYEQASHLWPRWADERRPEDVFNQLNAAIAEAEDAGVWAGLDYVRELKDKATAGEWAAFHDCGELLEYASRLIRSHLHPTEIPDCLRSEQEIQQAREAAEAAHWDTMDIEASGAQFTRDGLAAQVKALGGCPVVDTTAAAFQMVADGSAARMSDVMDLAAQDPGLALQVLCAANRGAHDAMTAIEDVRAAVSMLGEMKLNALARTLPQACGRHVDLPWFNWANYWKFQVAVGRVAEFVCKYLEFDYLKGAALTAGLIHDAGRLCLLKLQPHAFRAALRYAHDRKVSLAAAERKYFGCSGPEIGAAFAGIECLPPTFASVLRWVENPEAAETDLDLVAMVALARHICGQAHVGVSGDCYGAHSLGLTATAAWRMLQPRLFAGFDSRRLEVQAHAYCLNLKTELSGQVTEHRPTRAQRAAELV